MPLKHALAGRTAAARTRGVGSKTETRDERLYPAAFLTLPHAKPPLQPGALVPPTPHPPNNPPRVPNFASRVLHASRVMRKGVRGRTVLCIGVGGRFSGRGRQAPALPVALYSLQARHNITLMCSTNREGGVWVPSRPATFAPTGRPPSTRAYAWICASSSGAVPCSPERAGGASLGLHKDSRNNGHSLSERCNCAVFGL